MNKCPILLLFVFMVTACSPEEEHAPSPSELDAITLAPGTPSVKEFPAMGGLWALRFSATKAWSAVPADPVHAEWYRIEPAEGDDGNGTVKVTVLPNITTEKRSAEIIIRSGRAEQRLSFAQQASDMEPCDEEEVRRFLEKLYQDTGGDNWRFQENWCTDKPLSEWGSSVKYEDGKLSLILGENNLHGKIDLSGCTALVSLRCAKNSLTEIDVSGCPLLEELDCTNCGISGLDVSGCYSLRRLLCGYNGLTELGLSSCPYLTELNVPYNGLGTLDISSCMALTDLNCAENRLEKLDMAGREGLRMLFCYGNRLSVLDLSKCSSLTLVNCGANELTRLDLSGCEKLGRLYCYDNRLETLDLSDFAPLLSELYCYGNRLTELDLSGTDRLSQFECSYNNLQRLDLTGCKSLRIAGCARNALRTISLFGCEMLGQLDCSGNLLENIDISACPYLTELICIDNLILSEIPESFDRLTLFEHDIRYEYSVEKDAVTGQEKIVHTDRGKGWWYSGEPDKGCHGR